MKTQLNYLQAHSLRDLIDVVNRYNSINAGHPILRDDIAQILKEEGTYILLYYK